MVTLFSGLEDDQAFKDWMKQHQNGFYLNEGDMGTIRRGTGKMILHKVGCSHLGDGEGVVSTTYAKVAADDYADLVDWAEEKRLEIVRCSRCKPM